MIRTVLTVLALVGAALEGAVKLLERLRALDPHEADELAETIATNGK